MESIDRIKDAPDYKEPVFSEIPPDFFEIIDNNITITKGKL